MTGLLLGSSLRLTTAMDVLFRKGGTQQKHLQKQDTDDETRFLPRSNTSQVKNVSRVRHFI
jgi:hypothetical protein